MVLASVVLALGEALEYLLYNKTYIFGFALSHFWLIAALYWRCMGLETRIERLEEEIKNLRRS